MASMRSGRGLTYIETMITSVLIGLMILGTMSLLARVYRGITSSNLKTHSLNIAGDQIEILRSVGFDGLKITPDSCVPEPGGTYDVLDSPDNYEYPPETVAVGGNHMKVYKIVQYAHEDDEGNIVPYLQSEGDPSNIKQIRVVVLYTDNKIEKKSELTSLVTNKEVPVVGSVISGSVSYTSGGSPKDAVIYVAGHPEYTTQADTSGSYTIRNVLPGLYNLYTKGPSFTMTYYASNPLSCADQAATYSGVNFSVGKIVPSEVKGKVYIDTSVYEYLDVNATGQMTKKSKSGNWANPAHIINDDTNEASCTVHLGKLYSEFSNKTKPGTLVKKVWLMVKQRAISTQAGDYYRLYLNDDTAAFTTFPMSSGVTVTAVDITSLYAAWDWDKVKDLWIMLECSASNLTNPPFFGTAYINNVYLHVAYSESMQTVAGARVWSDNPASAPVSSANDGSYALSDLDPAYGAAAVYALADIGGAAYFGSVTNVPTSAGGSEYRDIICYPNTSTAWVFGKVYDATNRSTPLADINVELSDPCTQTAATNSSGIYGLTDADEGSWYISAAANDYRLEGEPSSVLVHKGANTVQNIYMFPVGKIAGTVTNAVTGAPIPGIKITARGSMGIGGDEYTAATDATGAFLIEGVAAGSNYKVEAEAEASGYDIESPPTKSYTALTVVKGATSPNNNFALVKKYGRITGSVLAGAEVLKDGVLVVAFPSGATGLPHQYRLNNTDASLVAQTGRNRQTAPSWGCMTGLDGSFTLNVPSTGQYDLYAYYSYISYTATGGKVVVNSYNSRAACWPDTDNNNIAGSWTGY